METAIHAAIKNLREAAKEHFFTAHFSELYGSPCPQCKDLNDELEEMKGLQAKYVDLVGQRLAKHNLRGVDSK